MTDHQNGGDADRIEALLRRAPPRPVPPAEDERAVREAVRAEWLKIVASRRRKRRYTGLGLAAGVVTVFAAALMTLRPGPDPAPPASVAQVDRHTGTVRVATSGGDSLDVSTISAIRAGQTIETAGDSALGLWWHDHSSLRIDQRSELEVVDEVTVHLLRGRLYVESSVPADESRLRVATAFGEVTHIGTQYMVAASDDSLLVSVREGRVSVDGRYYDATAAAGKRLAFTGSSRPVSVDLASYDEDWRWAEAVAPAIDLDGRNALEFLEWAARQTGFRLVFETPDARRLATRTRLVGRVETDPRTELRLRLLTTDLDYSLDAETGTLSVRLAPSGEP